MKTTPHQRRHDWRQLGAIVVALTLVVACHRRTAAPNAMPDADHAWTVDELERSAIQAEKLCATIPDLLPVVGTSTFDRMVAADNRTRLPAGPPNARQAALTRHTAAVLRLYTAYHDCGLPAETFTLNAALLEGYAESLTSSQQVIAALPSDAPDRARRVAGFDQMVAGLQGGIGSTVGMLINPNLPPITVAIATRVGSAIAAVRSHGPPGAFDPIIAELVAASDVELDPARHAALAAAAQPLR